ncbi:efflux RND transporter periplasmic adaptor subunit [Tropicibacter oceani]|uniref:Efflux RND transporter periplasmic adaptor subunit n=1 Tax=Tropicibacter oceani TaxID=3058420 RepID=A0ABY8QHM2_9RHOB|nr:efflux RND transporter periplasmic adaptor subunit [Tropicibacter oceani]WGW04144.1 efflux RND transporter periplasmic adaptor subunit [Tropicibacter oceani]
MKKLVYFAASLAIIAGAYVWSFGVPGAAAPGAGGAAPMTQGPGGPGGRGATTVVLTPLEMQPYEDSFRAIGSSEAVSSATVTADVSGRIVELNLTPNAEVSQGDVLVQLDARAATLSLETAQNELEQASATVTRYERLQQSGNSTVSEVTISEARLAQRLAEASVGQAELALEDLTIRAPISGKLGLSEIKVGDFITANTPIVTIDDASALLVEFELPERSVGFLSLGREVTLGTPSLTGRFFKGEITSFDSRIDAVTRSVTVKARVENPDGTLWPGMTFTARLSNLSDPLLVVPTTAITWSRDGASVWFEADGKAQSTPATILFRRDESVWLDVDLPVGTMMITEGAHKLRPGSAIADANAEPQQPVQEQK